MIVQYNKGEIGKTHQESVILFYLLRHRFSSHLSRDRFFAFLIWSFMHYEVQNQQNLCVRVLDFSLLNTSFSLLA